MVDIDWGDLTPTQGQRARVQARVAELAYLHGPVVALRRRGSAYEARVTSSMPNAPAEVRLSDSDLASVVDRACQLLAIVAHERRARAARQS